MHIEFSKRALKTMAKLDSKTRQRVVDAISKLPDGDIVPLEGAVDSYRLRVGGWRIVYTMLSANTIVIDKVAPRGDVYKKR